MSPGRQYRKIIPGVGPRFTSSEFSSRKRAVSHGGDLSKRKRKTARPLDPKQAIYVVLRSSRACGHWSMLHPKHCRHIHAHTQRSARKRGVRIYNFLNDGRRIHLLVKARDRIHFQRFLKETSGGIAQIVTGAKKGQPLVHSPAHCEGVRGFWDHLAFTMIVRMGAELKKIAQELHAAFVEWRSAAIQSTDPPFWSSC